MSQNPNSAVIRFFREKFEGFENIVLKTYNEKAWPTALVDWAYFWGSNKPVVRIPVELYMCNKVLNKDTAKSIQVLRDSVNYILGINPLSFSFISGFGENSVKNIYRGIFSNDNIFEVPKGYLAGGANQYEAGFMSNYTAKCYLDSDREWTTNEHAIYWNAAMVLCLTVTIGTIDK
jgi:endoglucanase